MHFFTSIATNYLPKARILAHSIHEHCADSFITLVVSDRLPSDFAINDEPFDEVLYIEDLDIPVDNLEMWIYKHKLVELCTAVKGSALVKLLSAGRYEKVVYLDPDIAVFDSLAELEETLNECSIVLTPHITEPEISDKGIRENEICTLMHGIYNLGFVAVRSTDEGMRFAKWWRDRLVDYCIDDIPNGLFTDQRWADMVPAMFDEVHIEKSPAYNVAVWNCSTRSVTKEGKQYYVNGLPLKFYHFTGFDSGANLEMMWKYGNTPEMWELREWYIQRLEDEGQLIYGALQGYYSIYSNGEPIPASHRRLLRSRLDVQKHFADSNPFSVQGDCVYSWMINETAIPEECSSGNDEPVGKYKALQNKVEEQEQLIATLQAANEKQAQLYINSTSWKITAPLRAISRAFKRNG